MFPKDSFDFADRQEIQRNRCLSYQVKRKRIGTTPPNSMWTEVQVVFIHYIKDLVSAPGDLTPGSYVLSFRWNGENLPQVVSGCSNIDII
jgi:hypothetical protein